MKKGLTEIVFILDRSGSMSGLEADTIGGFNGMLDKQKKEEGEAIVSTVLFDDRFEILHDRVDIKNVGKMTDKEYYVRGCTALLDAVGRSISHIHTMRKNTPKEERPEKTIFIITTDGMENASREYNYHKVSKMIKKCKEHKWEFIFLGANIDAAKEAGRLGIESTRAVNYVCDAAGTSVNFKTLNNALSRVRKCESAEAVSDIFDCEEESIFEPINAYYAANHK